MFERRKYQELLAWKQADAGSTALLLEGARRVGKTTLVTEFARREYESHLVIDFVEARRDVIDAFEDNRGDVDGLLRDLQLAYRTELKRGASLIVFDEVQELPRAREAIRALVADGRFHYVETGSLVSIRRNVRNIRIPSEERRLRLDPLDFEEWLWATGQSLIADEIRSCFESLRPLSQAAHRQAMRCLNQYLLTGGMPQAVQAFVDDVDYFRCDRIKRDILSLYAEDTEKFGSEGRRALAVFQEVPGQLSMESKRFRFSSVKKSARFREFEPAVRWLEQAHVANVCRSSTDPSVASALSENPSSLKVYLADTGLLVSQAFGAGPDVMGVYSAVERGQVSLNRGMLVENFVAQQLRARGHDLHYHTWDEEGSTGRNLRREIDFLLPLPFSDAAGKPRVSPLEVKSTKSYSTVSLDDFSKSYAGRVGNEYVLHPKQMRIEGKRRYLPLYMAHLL